LINLISNAYKFSKFGGTIFLHTTATPAEGKKALIMIDVCDQGIGIHKDDLRNLFKPYFKSSSAESKKLNPNGNGLGLSISKRIT